MTAGAVVWLRRRPSRLRGLQDATPWERAPPPGRKRGAAAASRRAQVTAPSRRGLHGAASGGRW